MLAKTGDQLKSIKGHQKSIDFILSLLDRIVKCFRRALPFVSFNSFTSLRHEFVMCGAEPAVMKSTENLPPQSQTVYIPILQRLISPKECDSVEKLMGLLGYGVPVHVASIDGSVFTVDKEVLSSMSRTFREFLKENPGFSESSRFCTKIKDEPLRAILSFLLSGKIEFHLDNVRMIFEAARHLQIECLVNASLEFLCARPKELLGVLFDLVYLHRDLGEVAENVIQRVCKSPKSYRDTLVRLNGKYFSEILERDEFTVESEDEIVDFVICWYKEGQPRSSVEILWVASTVRFDFLSKGWIGLPRLMSTFDWVENLRSLTRSPTSYSKKPRPSYAS